MSSKIASRKKTTLTKNSWKEAQSKTKKNRINKLALVVLGIIVFLLVLSWGIKFTQSLFSPLKQEASRDSHRWNGEFNINLLIRTPQIYLLSYNPTEKKITTISIPNETFLEVPFGFGFWQLGSIYELGQSRKQLGGNRLLEDTIKSSFATPVDGFLDFSSLPNKKDLASILEDLRKHPFSGISYLSTLKTNLTPWELLKLKTGIASVRFDKIKHIDLLKLNILESDELLDGTKVLAADPVKLDSVLVALADPEIISENKTIAVLNATDQPQLAQKWARLITNLGGNVIITANAEQRLKKTKVVGEDSLTLKRLQKIFQLDCQDGPECGKVGQYEDVASSRAQINLLLGEDFTGDSNL